MPLCFFWGGDFLTNVVWRLEWRGIKNKICLEFAEHPDIESFQTILTSRWESYFENIHVCMTDAICYESFFAFLPVSSSYGYCMVLLASMHNMLKLEDITSFQR